MYFSLSKDINCHERKWVSGCLRHKKNMRTKLDAVIVRLLLSVFKNFFNISTILFTLPELSLNINKTNFDLLVF
jgi:hypothetical protein